MNSFCLHHAKKKQQQPQQPPPPPPAAEPERPYAPQAVQRPIEPAHTEASNEAASAVDERHARFDPRQVQHHQGTYQYPQSHFQHQDVYYQRPAAASPTAIGQMVLSSSSSMPSGQQQVFQINPIQGQMNRDQAHFNSYLL
ncbi:hypothetical protein GGI25_006459, partial [Coemansia spiralis]